MSGTAVLNNSPYENIVPSNGKNAIVMSQGLPEDLRAAYKEIKALCDTMDTCLEIHSYARELYETVYQSRAFASEPQKTITAGCLFIAYGATDKNLFVGERKISYLERCLLAPATDHDVLRVFAALETFFKYKSTKVLFVGGDEPIDRAAINTEKGRDAAMEEVENANDAVEGSTKLLLEAFKRIETCCECLPLSPRTWGYVTAHSKVIYKKVHLSGGFNPDERTAVVGGCFYLAFRRLKVPCTLRQVWILTGVPIEETKAVVKDLVKFFTEELRFVQRARREAGDPPHERDTTSPSDRSHSISDNEAERRASVLATATAMDPTTLAPATVRASGFLLPSLPFTAEAAKRTSQAPTTAGDSSQDVEMEEKRIGA